MSTAESVGVYSPVGVERAMEMSACGRIVSVGFAVESAWGVMDERSRGHWIMALERVLRRIGRYVSLVYCAEGGTSGPEGAG